MPSPHRLPNPTKVVVGYITDVIAYAHWYSVQVIDENIGQISCVSAESEGAGPHGPRNFGMYSPGTAVLVAVPVSAVWDNERGNVSYAPFPPGYILGAVPTAAGSNTYRSSDWVAPFIGTNSVRESVHTALQESFPDTLQDYNESRPPDAVPGSDAGVIGDFGAGYGTSRLFSWMRASDVAGVWCFVLDNLVRLAAYNYELRTAGGEHTVKNDEGEVNEVTMSSPYPWETAGGISPGAAISVARPLGGLYSKSQNDLANEPEVPDALPRSRYMRLGGYVGGGIREQIRKPAGGTGSAIGVDAGKRHTGLSDIQYHENGHISIRSALGITLEKYLYLPAPDISQLPEASDLNGDGMTNYKPAGTWGPESTTLKQAHEKQEWRWGVHPSGWHSALYDAHAYMFNWYGFRALMAHISDWTIPQEGLFDGDEGGRAVIDPLRFSDLGFYFLMNTPASIDIEIDHRQTATRYYRTRSIISQLTDGSIVLEDGYGTSINMVGGNMYLSGAGDIWLKPGRSIINWAPDDLILRCGSSCDISASGRDIRIAARHNVQVTAGMRVNEYGGILLQTNSQPDLEITTGSGEGPYIWANEDGDLAGEAQRTYGLTVDCRTSPIQMRGFNVFLRAGQGSSATGDDGHMILDAGSHMSQMGRDSFTRYGNNGFIDVLNRYPATPNDSGEYPFFDDFGVSICSICPQEAAESYGDDVLNVYTEAATYFGACELFRVDADQVFFDAFRFHLGGELDVLDDATFHENVCVTGSVTANEIIEEGPSSSPCAGESTFCDDLETYTTGSGLGDVIRTSASPTEIYSYENTVNALKIPAVDDNIMINFAKFWVAVQFTFRKDDDYDLGTDFAIFEERWQQLRRLNGDDGDGWDEISLNVLDDEGNTGDLDVGPHPGTLWATIGASGNSFRTYEPTLYGPSSGFNPARPTGDVPVASDKYYQLRKTNEEFGDESGSPESVGDDYNGTVFQSNYIVTRSIGWTEPD